jgi:hypothetical protein
VRVLSETEWVSKRYRGNAAGAFNRITMTIDVREGYESSILHELIHSSLGHSNQSFFIPLVEGVVEAVTQEIAKRIKLVKPLSYTERVGFLKFFLLPYANMTLQEFAQKYAASPKKGPFLKREMQTAYWNAGGNNLPKETKGVWNFFYKDLL